MSKKELEQRNEQHWLLRQFTKEASIVSIAGLSLVVFVLTLIVAVNAWRSAVRAEIRTEYQDADIIMLQEDQALNFKMMQQDRVKLLHHLEEE